MKKLSLTCMTLIICIFAIQVPAAEPVIWQLWPSEPPGGTIDLPAEYNKTKKDDKLVAGRSVIRLSNVTNPTLAIHKPNKKIDTGTTIIVAPGGGHSILAYDLEGTEIAEWLNSIGVTAIILKYRVPGRAFNKVDIGLAAAQDGQRAVSLVRGKAAELGIKPEKIGIMGFSAGGTPVKNTAMVKERLYQPVDKYDNVSFTPNFAAPIYSGGLPPNMVISKASPPFFIVTAHDDKYSSLYVTELYTALKKAGASAELHIYESGGHGYGLRKTGLPIASWPERMKEWMIRLKLL
ncbi:alpha/beta hydrolase [Colwelliaceae bacterium BS250]